MNYYRHPWALGPLVLSLNLAVAAPIIDPLPNVTIPAGKSLTIPITATSLNGRPLTYTITSSANGITVEHHTNNPFWKMSVVQAAATNAPGAFQTPFREGLATVTNVGDMTFMLLRDRAPRTVDAIAGLTTSGFYNSNTIFHRVVLVPYFTIQGGDPFTNGSGGPVFRFDDERHPRSLFTGSGQLGSVRSGLPDTDGSQFFITAAPQRGFDLRYTIFGQLLRGFNVLTNVLNTPINTNSRPLADVIITRASLVPNPTDTVITLTATNQPGIAGTIRVIADDGEGQRTTNTFTATTVTDPVNSIPMLNSPAITNLIVPVNGSLTNFVSTLDFEGDAVVYDAWYVDQHAVTNATFTTTPDASGKFIFTPNPGYSGPLRIYVAVAADLNSYFNSIYDYQQFTVAVGDTVITAFATNFVASPGLPFTDQALAAFANGVPNSPVGNFTAFINWGDNSTNSGVIFANASGNKEVHGTHTYTNAGQYPVYITIRSSLGAEATVVATAYVPPSVSLTRTGTTNLLSWPAWATDYQLLSRTNLAAGNWTPVTNLPALVGYETVVTNPATGSNGFFRLKH